MSFNFTLFCFKFIVYVCIYYFFKIYFIFLVDRGIKPASTCGAGDGGRVCLLAGGPLDCSQSSIFP